MGKGPFLFLFTVALLVNYSRGWDFGFPTNIGGVETAMTSGFSGGVETVTGLNSNATKSAMELVPIGSGTGAKLDEEGRTEVICRPGFRGNPVGLYFQKFTNCWQRLEAASNGSSATLECVRICVWLEYEYADKATGLFNRTAYENSAANIEDFPGPTGVASRKTLADDFEYCWERHHPSLKYDKSGCKKNKPFTQCFKERSVISCKGTGGGGTFFPIASTGQAPGSSAAPSPTDPAPAPVAS